MRSRLLASLALTATTLVALTACYPDVSELTPVSGTGQGSGGAATSAPQPQVTPDPGTGAPAPSDLVPDGELLNQVNYQDLTIYIYRVGQITTTEPSIYARPDGTDPYPAGTTVEATAYVLVNNSDLRLDLTDLSADYSSYGNDLAQQDTFAGQDLLAEQGYTTELETQFPEGASTWALLPGESVVFANAWFHRPTDGPLTLQFLWPAERIFLGANVQF